jgi:predicted exporter
MILVSLFSLFNGFFDFTLGAGKNYLMIYKWTRVINTILACVLALILSITSITASSAQDNGPYIARIPSMESDQIGPLHPVGLSFSFGSKTFYVVEDRGQLQASAVNSDVIAISPFADRKGAAR